MFILKYVLINCNFPNIQHNQTPKYRLPLLCYPPDPFAEYIMHFLPGHEEMQSAMTSKLPYQWLPFKVLYDAV